MNNLRILQLIKGKWLEIKNKWQYTFAIWLLWRFKGILNVGFLCFRTYGPLKAEYRLPSGGRSYRRAVSEIAGGQSIPGRMSAWRPDVLPGPSDVPDSSQDRYPATTVRRKESVARMTWDGLSYVVTVNYNFIFVISIPIFIALAERTKRYLKLPLIPQWVTKLLWYKINF